MLIGPVSWNYTPLDKESQKTIAAAKDFEALLIGQMLKSMREERSGWLGSGNDSGDDSSGDSTSDAILSIGEQQMAKALSAGGGLGLAHMIEANLKPATR